MKFVALIAVSMTCAVPLAAAAQADIFVCVDAEGNKTFQNIGNAKGCKRMDTGPVLTVPGAQTAGLAGTLRLRAQPRSEPARDLRLRRACSPN